jgi:hypothetical protein
MGISLGGESTWTPTYVQVGTQSVEVAVSDGDGGSDSQSFTLVVGFLDFDNDSLSDTWELDNGLDPTNAGDAALDPDADGLTNLAEFLGGTDPNVYDGPDVPVLVSPIGGEEIADASPPLVWQNASDPQNDALTYDVEVYDDEFLSILLTSTTAVAEGSGTSTWTVDVTLPENAESHWRARAHDGNVAGTWSDLEACFVNVVNDEPSAPVAISPLNDDSVSVARPGLRWAESVDPDEDELTYTVRVRNEALDTVIASASDLEGGVRDGAWEVAVDLEEDTFYAWDVQAIDEHGLEGPWSEVQEFFVNLTNGPPAAVVFTAPDDGARIESVSPLLSATESVDPEGDRLTYAFQIDTASNFASADLQGTVLDHTGTGEVVWDLDGAAVRLRDNVEWFARVRALDAEGGVSDWDEISFFILGDNDPPPIPALVSPEDEALDANATPVFVIGHVEDPEGDGVSYAIRAATAPDGNGVVASVESLAAGEGPEGTADQTSWASDVALSGIVYWSAQSVDDQGAASEWSEPRIYTVEVVDEPPPPDDTEGCACEESSIAAASGVGPWAVLALLIAGVRRRRGWR